MKDAAAGAGAANDCGAAKFDESDDAKLDDAGAAKKIKIVDD